MSLHLRAICPECGDEVENAGQLCTTCEEAELTRRDDDLDDDLCPECHDVYCDGDCVAFNVALDDEIDEDLEQERRRLS